MKNCKSSAFVVGLMGLAAASGAGCMDGETGEVEPAPIATLDTASGAHVDFYEPTFSEVDNGTYRIEILQASGDAYHLSIHGDK